MLDTAGYGYVEFATRLGVNGVVMEEKSPTLHAGVSIVDDPDGDIAAPERVGDHVQVCLLVMPIPTKGQPDVTSRNPDTDPRGREYRVYDYRQHAAYVGYNAEGQCGGA